MNEHELRLIVREAVGRHLGAPAQSMPPHSPTPQPLTPQSSMHASHALYAELVNVSEACVIEPSVACDHCGYCKSHGH